MRTRVKSLRTESKGDVRDTSSSRAVRVPGSVALQDDLGQESDAAKILGAPGHSGFKLCVSVLHGLVSGTCLLA